MSLEAPGLSIGGVANVLYHCVHSQDSSPLAQTIYNYKYRTLCLIVFHLPSLIQVAKLSVTCIAGLHAPVLVKSKD